MSKGFSKEREILKLLEYFYSVYRRMECQIPNAIFLKRHIPIRPKFYISITSCQLCSGWPTDGGVPPSQHPSHTYKHGGDNQQQRRQEAKQRPPRGPPAPPTSDYITIQPPATLFSPAACLRILRCLFMLTVQASRVAEDLLIAS